MVVWESGIDGWGDFEHIQATLHASSQTDLGTSDSQTQTCPSQGAYSSHVRVEGTPQTATKRWSGKGPHLDVHDGLRGAGPRNAHKAVLVPAAEVRAVPKMLSQCASRQTKFDACLQAVAINNSWGLMYPRGALV